MASSPPLRGFLIVAFGAIVYYALLGIAYSQAPYLDMPQWWNVHAISKQAAVISWFTLLNVGGAVLSAIPVAIGLTFVATRHRFGSALAIGLLPALVIVVGGLSRYGLPLRGGEWFADTAQFVGIAGAVTGVLALIEALRANKSLWRARKR